MYEWALCWVWGMHPWLVVRPHPLLGLASWGLANCWTYAPASARVLLSLAVRALHRHCHQQSILASQMHGEACAHARLVCLQALTGHWLSSTAGSASQFSPEL